MTTKILIRTLNLSAILNDFKPTPGYSIPSYKIVTLLHRFLYNGEHPEELANNHKLHDVYMSWREPHRYYHDVSHLNELFDLIDFLESTKHFSNRFIQQLYLIALFHDAVYNPRSDSNEMDSALLFKKCVERAVGVEMHTHEMAFEFEEIWQAIMDTKTHDPKSELSEVFCALDMYVISHYSFEKLLKYEHQIYKEYQFVPYNIYKLARIEILQTLNQKYQRKEIEMLIEYIKFRIPRVGVYAGSFKPFHIGHKNILEKAELMFDKVIVARGINPDKVDNNEFLTNLEEIFPYHQIEFFKGYLYDFLHTLRQTGIEPYLIKGLRNAEDFNYELMQDYYNKHIFFNRTLEDSSYLPMHTVSVFGDQMFANVSSSAIRAMEKIEKGSGKWFVVKQEKQNNQ